jgi:hypothetical protein
VCIWNAMQRLNMMTLPAVSRRFQHPVRRGKQQEVSYLCMFVASSWVWLFYRRPKLLLSQLFQVQNITVTNG